MNSPDDSVFRVLSRLESGGLKELPEIPEGASPENVAFLRKLIESFNDSSGKLKEAYSSLQDKFDRLNLKLDEANHHLKRSLEEQERLSNYLTNILESLTSGVLVVDKDGIIQLFNRGAEAMIGIPAKMALSKPYREVMGKSIPEELTPLGILSSGVGFSQLEKTLENRDGTTIPVGFSISPLLNRKGALIGAVEIFMDLSAIKALEDEISRMDKLAALGQMAAVMAHKIRNPLGGIAGFAGLLDLEFGGNKNGKRLVGKITEGVNKLNRIVSSLVSYTSNLNLRPHKSDLGDRIWEVFHLFEMEDSFLGKNIQFAVHETSGQIAVELDHEQFRIALQKIVLNSLEAMEEGGTVTAYIIRGDSEFTPSCPIPSGLLTKIRNSSRLLSSRMPCAVIIITDTGIGMEPESMANLFVPFYTTKENGIGLGLASAKKIIEAHHGELWLSSVYGRGTAAGILLPFTSMKTEENNTGSKQRQLKNLFKSNY
jgi:PAS domain S-box-containing protein